MITRKMKLMPFVLSTILVGSMTLAGCGKTGETTSTASPSTAGTETKAPSLEAKKLDPVTLKWYLPQGTFPDAKAVFAEMSKITKEKINADLDIELVDWGNYDQKMQAVLASGENVDLMFTSNWSNDYVSAVNKGAFMDITDLLKKYGTNILKQVPEKAWNAPKINGKLYGIINTQVLGKAPGMLINKTYADKYGLDASKVKKLEDLTPFLEKVAVGEKDKYAFNVKGNDDPLSYIGTALGIEYFADTNPGVMLINDNDTKIVNLFETKEYTAFLKLMHEWYQKGIIRRDAPTITDLAADEKAGKYITRIGVMNPDVAANQAERYGNGKPENVLTAQFSPAYMSTGSILGTLTAIPRTSKNPERAMMFYDLMYSDAKLFNLMNYGIENKHYKKVGDDLIETIPNSGYNVASGWEYGNMFNSYRTSPLQPKWFPVGPDMNNTAISSKLLGFSFDASKVKSELAQCAAVITEFNAGLITGALDPDTTLPKLNEKLKKAGMDKLLAEMQTQIDAWKVANKK
ncbi:ABC transporter substrate-binding protein [Paenibacillus marchantiophytorum]|uniref:ABC transporter substrate-binding protein n=1 Tax=Paenibacillus marchantiophytorum TaxID=1619310 RepID=A0ABQ2BQ59_9BACL|nr:extracellular solute-binding protein [Paenibacillus marchantiophytorum]GGI44013.1 ABC transporter substrate-binding protein [Paenibacillus marchantiophytorum]